MPSTTRNFEYQDPKKQNFFLTGHARVHIPEKTSKENKTFRDIKVVPQPDSRRTLEPQLAVRTNIIIFY